MKKRNLILPFLIILFIVPFVLANTSGSGGIGDGGAGAATGSGSWNYIFGFKIAVFNSNHEQQGNVISVEAYNDYNGKWKISDLKGWFSYVTLDNGKSWSSQPTILYDFLDIPYLGTSGNYSKLKEYIKGIELQTGYYVLIEPYTRIGGKDITFRGISNATVKVPNNNGTLVPFQNWYYRAAVVLANAAKVGNNITVGGITYTAQNGTCTGSSYLNGNYCGYSSKNKYIGYGITVVKQEDMEPEPNGSLKITKVNSNNDKLAQLTSSTTAKFRLYTNSSCSEGTHIKDFEAGETISNLTPGTYYLKEYQTKKGYHLPEQGEDYYCTAITISSGLKEITITNKTECEYKFKSNMTMKERIDLYNLIKTNYNHEFNALLDMNNTTAASACSNIPAVKNYTKSCFGAGNTITNSSNFSNTNVSMHTEKYGTYTFCLTKYNMVNNLGKTRFYNIQAGKAIISTDSVVATATLNRVCYNFGDETIEDPEYNNLSYSNYIEEDASIGGVPLIKTETSSGTINNKTITATYTLPEMYASNRDGKIHYGYCPSGEYCKSLGKGIISKFNSKPSNPLSPSTPSTPSTPSKPSNTIYHKLGFNIVLKGFGELKSSSDCTYTIKTGLITPNNKLNIEFRPVNTNSESIFLGKDGSNRKIGSNWSKEEDREFVLNVKNNSYNKNNEEPLYTILLTPDTMEDIRKDNKDKTYDDYNMTCTEDGMTCISNYLTCLVNSNELQIKPIRKNLDKFKENQIVCKY